MLTRLVDEPPGGDGWVHEIKWDGFRVLARLGPAGPELWSRSDQDLTGRFAAVARRLEPALHGRECVLDGEVCALDEEGRPRFSLLQRGEGQLVYEVFDLLELDGEPLLDRPLAERRELLESLMEPDDPVVRLSGLFPDGAGLLAAAVEQALEGIVSKRADSPYRPGERTSDWQKAKARMQQELVIAGYTRGHGARARLGSLVLAVNEGGGLRWAGNCGTGFTHDELERLRARLQPLERKTSPLDEVPAELRRASRQVTWVTPRLVCEVAFAEWTRGGRLRAPVYLGLREDVTPGQVRRETPAPPPREPARRVRVTNRDKVFFPDDGITKGDLVDYYEAMAHVLVPHLIHRPFTMVRLPDGIAGKRFFQKNRPAHMPDWIPDIPLPARQGERRRTIRWPLVNDVDALVWMVNAGCVDMNVWYSRDERLERPDFVLFDLDPAEGSGFAEAAEVALLVREALELMGLRGHPKTSGADGMHVMVPIDPVHTYDEARDFCRAVAEALAGLHPRLVTTEWTRSRRRGVLIDANQVASGKTVASVYSVRPRPGAPVSTPLAWDEVEAGPDPRELGMRQALDRMERLGDRFAPVLEGGQRLGRAIERLRGEVGSRA